MPFPDKRNVKSSAVICYNNFVPLQLSSYTAKIKINSLNHCFCVNAVKQPYNGYCVKSSNARSVKNHRSQTGGMKRKLNLCIARPVVLEHAQKLSIPKE